MATVLVLFGCQARADRYDDAMAAFTRADYPRTLELVRPLVEQGDPRAQSLLGVMYDHGSGVPKDPIRATELYTEAARQGFAEAQFYLGQRSKDPAEAAAWYLKAAQQGFMQAQNRLAAFYEFGSRGVPRNEVQAAYWWDQSAERGDREAQSRLGEMYAQGRGVQSDPVQALMWLDLAQGGPGPNHVIYERPENPRTRRDALAAALTPEQVAEGDRRAYRWIAQHRK